MFPGEKTLSFSLAKLIVFTKRVKENLIKRTTAKKFATKRLLGPGLKKKARKWNALQEIIQEGRRYNVNRREEEIWKMVHGHEKCLKIHMSIQTSTTEKKHLL